MSEEKREGFRLRENKIREDVRGECHGEWGKKGRVKKDVKGD